MQPTPSLTVKDLTRDAVTGVFKQMLDMDMSEADPVSSPPDDGPRIISSVGFIGQTTGIICLNASVTFASAIACRMLGMTPEELDDGSMVNDVFGELANVIVGSVKSQICDNGSSCTLTIPSIVRGNHLCIEAIPHTEKTVLGFSSGEGRLIVEILIKNS